MNRPSIAAQGIETLTLSDFELVRNARGTWLLIVTQAPAAFIDNPLQTLAARIDAEAIVIESAFAKMQLQNILSAQYISALQTDRPDTILFSVVDEEGTRHFSAHVPCVWN